MLFHSCRRWLLHTRACQHLQLLQSSYPCNSIATSLHKLCTAPSHNNVEEDTAALLHELQLSRANATTNILYLIDRDWPSEAPIALIALRQGVVHVAQHRTGHPDDLHPYVLAAYNTLLKGQQHPNPQHLCILALLAGIARHKYHRGPKRGLVKPVGETKGDAESTVRAIVEYFTEHPLDPTSLPPSHILALMTGAHMGWDPFPPKHFDTFLKLSKALVPQLGLCDLGSLIWRLSCLNRSGVPASFVQAQASAWLQRFVDAVEAVGGVGGGEDPATLPPYTKANLMAWARQSLAIQACAVICCWQRVRDAASTPPNVCRPSVDITLPAQLVALQSPYMGAVRWLAEGLLGFAHMGLAADHPTIEALAARLTRSVSTMSQQHLRYTCVALQFLQRVPRTFRYPAFGRRVNQLLVTIQKGALNDLLQGMAAVGLAPPTLDRELLGYAIMLNVRGRRYVVHALNALNTLGWIPTNVDVNRLLSTIDPNTPATLDFVLCALQACARHARYVSPSVAASLLHSTIVQDGPPDSPPAKARCWFALLPHLAQCRLTLPAAHEARVVSLLSDFLSFMPLDVVVKAVQAAVRLRVVVDTDDTQLLTSWVEFAVDYISNHAHALDGPLARQLLEAAVLLEAREVMSALLPTSLQHMCEELALEGGLEEPEVRLEGVVEAAAAMPELSDVTGLPATVLEAMVVADAYATVVATGDRVAVRAPLQRLQGAPVPMLTGTEAAQALIAEHIGVRIIEVVADGSSISAQILQTLHSK